LAAIKLRSLSFAYYRKIRSQTALKLKEAIRIILKRMNGHEYGSNKRS
jgi:hypothetical protein